MGFEKLRKTKPLLKDINEPGGRPDPRFHGMKFDVPAKLVHNSTDNELLSLYTKGELKWPDTGSTCENCINYYPDLAAKYGGRCKAHGYAQTHKDTPAEDQPKGWTHPVENVYFPFWPGCPDYVRKERLSRR